MGNTNIKIVLHLKERKLNIFEANAQGHLKRVYVIKKVITVKVIKVIEQITCQLSHIR